MRNLKPTHPSPEHEQMTDADSVDDIAAAQLDIDRERLRIEQRKVDVENRFWNKNVGTVITAMISLVAIIVSLAQVWVAKISKDKEIQITSIQKKSEMDLLDKQKEKELALLDEQHKREWSLNVAKFVTENRKALFSEDPKEQEVFAKLIPTIFPKDISDSILDKLIAVSSPSTKKVWIRGKSPSPASPSPSPVKHGCVGGPDLCPPD